MINHHTPGFDELPWYEWHAKASLWERGLSPDEVAVGDFVEVMCCWALRRAKETGLPVYGEVIRIDDTSGDGRNSVPGRIRYANHIVRVRDKFDMTFGSMSYLRKTTLLEVMALEAYERPALSGLIWLKVPEGFPSRPSFEPHPYYSVITIGS